MNDNKEVVTKTTFLTVVSLRLVRNLSSFSEGFPPSGNDIKCAPTEVDDFLVFRYLVRLRAGGDEGRLY